MGGFRVTPSPHRRAVGMASTARISREDTRGHGGYQGLSLPAEQAGKIIAGRQVRGVPLLAPFGESFPYFLSPIQVTVCDSLLDDRIPRIMGHPGVPEMGGSI